MINPALADAASLEAGNGEDDLRFSGSLSPSFLSVSWETQGTLLGTTLYTVRFTDTNDPPHAAPGSGCFSDGPATVSCLLEGVPQIRIDLGAGDDVIDEISGDGRAPSFDIHGQGGRDKLLGGGGSDRINGGGGADQIRGAAGHDILVGGPGPDNLRGQSGADRLRGKAGTDTLVGGSSQDFFGSGPGTDIIMSLDGVFGERVNCGGAADAVLSDSRDLLKSCEDVRYGRALSRKP